MKTIFKFVIPVCTLLLLSFAGCKKENTSAKDAATFQAGLQEIINNNQPLKTTTSVTVSYGASIIGNNTRFLFQPNAFTDEAGNIVTGNVDVQIQEFYKKSQMILANKTTMASDGLLESRGEVYVNATQNGRPLRIRSGYAKIQFEATDYNKPMKLFAGTVSATTNDVTWTVNSVVPVSNSNLGCSIASTYPFPPAYLYGADSAICDTLHTFPLDSFGWINCDYFMRDIYTSVPVTDVTINVPSGYDKTNTNVYVVFSNINAVMSVHNYSSGAFIMLGGYQVPIGMQATIVALNYHSGSWYSSFTSVTFVNNHVVNLTFAPTTIAVYTAKVNAL